MGNFKVDRPFEHHLVDISTWSILSADQQSTKFKRVMVDKGRANVNEMTKKRYINAICGQKA